MGFPGVTSGFLSHIAVNVRIARHDPPIPPLGGFWSEYYLQEALHVIFAIPRQILACR